LTTKKRQTWTPEEEAELLQAYRARRGGSHTEFARDYLLTHPGRTPHGVRQKLMSLLEGEGIAPVTESPHPDWNDAPQIIGDALIMSDLHLPYHNAAHVNRCITAAKRAGVSQLILAGDALDMRAFSHWPDDFTDSERLMASKAVTGELLKLAKDVDAATAERLYQLADKISPENGNINEEITTARDFFKTLEKNFERVWYIMGNHEKWAIRMLQKTISNADFARLFSVSPKWIVSPYYWCKLESNGQPYQIEHPTNAGKGSSKRLVPIFGCNIIMGHNHHFSVQTDPSGKWLAIEPGTCADVNKIQYDNQRHGSHDAHVTGAVMVKNGKAHLLNQFTDWDLYL